MQMNNIWLEILPHHHFPPKNPSRYLSLLISAAWNSLVLVWNALQGISVPANNETVSQQFMRIPQILHLPLLGLAHSRHRRCSIPQLPVFFSVWNRCLLSKFCPSSFALEKNKAWVRSSKAHVSCGIESKELGYQVCYGTQISQISVKGLVTKLVQKMMMAWLPSLLSFPALRSFSSQQFCDIFLPFCVYESNWFHESHRYDGCYLTWQRRQRGSIASEPACEEIIGREDI